MRSTQLLTSIGTCRKTILFMGCMLMLIGERASLAETINWRPEDPFYQAILQVPSDTGDKLTVFTLRQKGSGKSVSLMVTVTADKILQAADTGSSGAKNHHVFWHLNDSQVWPITLSRTADRQHVTISSPGIDRAFDVAKFPADQIDFGIPPVQQIPPSGGSSSPSDGSSSPSGGSSSPSGGSSSPSGGSSSPSGGSPVAAFLTALYIAGFACVIVMLYALQRRMRTFGISLKSEQEQLGLIHQRIASADRGPDQEMLDEIVNKLASMQRGTDAFQGRQDRFDRSTTALEQYTKDFGSYAAKIEVALNNQAKHTTGGFAAVAQEQVKGWIATVQQKTKDLDTVATRLNELLYGDVQRMVDRPGFVTLQKKLVMAIETLHAILQEKERQGMASDLQQVYTKMQELLEPIHTQFDELFQMALSPHPEPQPNSDMHRRLEALENSLLEINRLLQTIHDTLKPMSKPTSMPDDAEHDKEIISAASPPTSSQEQEISPVSVTTGPLIMSEQRPEATEDPARKAAHTQSGSPAPSEAASARSDSLAYDQMRPRSPSQTYDPSQWQTTIPILLRQLEAADNAELNTILAQIKVSFALLTDRWEDRYGAGSEPLGKLNGWSKSGVKELDRALYFVPKFDAASLAEPSRRIAVALFEAWVAAQKSRRKELRGRGIERIEVSSGVTQQKRDFVVAMDGVYIQTNDSSAFGKASHIEPGFGGYQINGQTIHPTEAVFFIQAGGRG